MHTLGNHCECIGYVSWLIPFATLHLDSITEAWHVNEPQNVITISFLLSLSTASTMDLRTR